MDTANTDVGLRLVGDFIGFDMGKVSAPNVDGQTHTPVTIILRADKGVQEVSCWDRAAADDLVGGPVTAVPAGTRLTLPVYYSAWSKDGTARLYCKGRQSNGTAPD